ncbi:MAG: hypothetical protein R3C05_08635 [Pirellulaceae bacterium]
MMPIDFGPIVIGGNVTFGMIRNDDDGDGVFDGSLKWVKYDFENFDPFNSDPAQRSLGSH